MESISENKTTPITRRTDTVVCGGGFAGVSAALAAARTGARVVLLERGFLLGGLGTAGLITAFLALCDGCGHQVSFGIPEELLRLSVSQGAEKSIPEQWLKPASVEERCKRRFEAYYNPTVCAVLMEQLLQKAGVEILYGTYAVDVRREGRRITHVITESKSGRGAILVKNVVDATGDADICAFAGVPTVNFAQGNVLAAWYYYSSRQVPYALKVLGVADTPDDQKKPGETVEMISSRRFGGLDATELSEMVQMSHAKILEDVLEKRKQDDAYWPVNAASIPQVRMTRRIEGAYTLDVKQMHSRMEDSIGMVSDWRKPGPVYEVPYGTLYSPACANLICAGRCTSVTESMWDIMRVIPCCTVTGQAAGTAAALTDDFSVLPVAALQRTLEKDGVRLHEQDLTD